MKVLKKGRVRKFAVKRDPFYKRIAGGPRPLVTQRCLEKCQSQESSFGTPHLPTKGTEVAHATSVPWVGRRVWSQVMAAVMEIK